MINIDYDGKVFQILSDYAGGMAVRNMPQRVFKKTPRPHWEAKALKGNARYIKEKLKTANLTRDAAAKITELLANDEKTLPVTWRGDYPWKTEPYARQMQFIRNFYGKSAWALFADPGCGKSFMSLTLAGAYMLEGLIQGVIAVSRVSLRDNWLDEAVKHLPDELNVKGFTVDSSKPATLKELAKPKEGHFLVSVGVDSLQVKEGGGKAFDAVFEIAKKYNCMLIVDEAHGVKNHNAIRSINCCLIAQMCKIRGILTGTPTPKDILDLYSQFHILDPDIIGVYNYYAFRAQYAVMGGYEGKQVLTYKNEDELMNRIKPYTDSMTLDEITELPEIIYQSRYIDMTDDLKKAYLDMVRDRLVEVDGKQIEATQVIAMYSKLRQMANGFIYDSERNYHELPGNHPKKRELLDILEGTNCQVIVWCNTHGEVHALNELLKGYTVANHHGKLSTDQRSAEIARFKSGEARILVATIAATGTGLTLTEAKLEVFYSLPLSYTDYLQAVKRCHRIGQHSTVTVINLLMKGTIEEKISAALLLKKDILEYVLESVKTGVDITEVMS